MSVTTPGPRSGPRRTLLVAGVLEPVTLLILLINLATMHAAGVAALVGPVHGTLYLIAILTTWLGEFPRRAQWLVWLPGLGALLAARATSPANPAGGAAASTITER